MFIFLVVTIECLLYTSKKVESLQFVQSHNFIRNYVYRFQSKYY